MSRQKGHRLDRREFLQGLGASAGVGALGLNGCTKHVVAAAVPTAPAANAFPFYDKPGPIVPIRADVDRIFRITVCTRPFRPMGPRMDTVRVGDKFVVHNYGHGGSGWSLSWGSADMVVRKVIAEAGGVRDVAVIGAGAIGMTTALTAQRYGLKTTIYTRERFPYVRSARATGGWTPDSRIAFRSKMASDFPETWEKMARTSLTMHESYIGSAAAPVEWTDRYTLTDDVEGAGGRERPATGHDWATFEDRIADAMPRAMLMPPGTTPFPTKIVRRSTTLTFNVADYARQLMADFEIAGGQIETREFHTPNDFAQLPERAVIDCPGYAARQLWGDESVVPVRGQIAWLIPQDGVRYGIYYKGVGILARRDGIVVQPSLGGDEAGWNDDSEVPDRAQAEAGVRVLQELYSRMEKNG